MKPPCFSLCALEGNLKEKGNQPQPDGSRDKANKRDGAFCFRSNKFLIRGFDARCQAEPCFPPPPSATPPPAPPSASSAAGHRAECGGGISSFLRSCSCFHLQRAGCDGHLQRSSCSVQRTAARRRCSAQGNALHPASEGLHGHGAVPS